MKQLYSFYICLELVFSFQTFLLNRISKIFLLFDLQKKAEAEEPKILDFNDGLSSQYQEQALLLLTFQ